MSLMRWSTCSGDICSLYFMWISLVARNTWIRGCLASFTASQAASMSPFVQRAREATVQLVTAPAMAWTLLWSMGEAMAKPASMMSTPSFSSCFAISIFSERFMLQPGDCSPSLRVVSKILICFMVIPPAFYLQKLSQTNKKAFVSSKKRRKLNFRGTTLIGIKNARFRHRPGSRPDESRLFGNGEETRSRLNMRLSGTTQGPVTSFHSALPRSGRQLSEASVARLFPRHRISDDWCWGYYTRPPHLLSRRHFQVFEKSTKLFCRLFYFLFFLWMSGTSGPVWLISL